MLLLFPQRPCSFHYMAHLVRPRKDRRRVVTMKLWVCVFVCVLRCVLIFFSKKYKKKFIVILHFFIKKYIYIYNENTAIPDPFFSLNFSKTLYSRYYNLFLQFTLTSVSLTLLPKSFFQIVIMVHRLTFRVTNNNAILGSYADI